MRFSGFLLLAFLQLTSVLVSALNNKKHDDAAMVVKKINKPALLTIESPDEGLTDCVNKRKQPTFHPHLLKGHKIQRMPAQRKKLKRHILKNITYKVSQILVQNGTRRHEDTIPIRRSTLGDVARAYYVSEFGKKQHPFYQKLETSENYDHAIALFHTSRKVYGAQAIINVWQPLVYGLDHSTAQIWIKSGDSDRLDVIEVGWHVYPSLYGDNKTRLFISWTNDSSQQSGCYNLFCEGFVDTSDKIYIGNSYHVSQSSGPQRYLDIVISEDRSSEHWRLKVNDIEVGYWPANIFTNSREATYRVDWGGEVYRVMIDEEYKSTQMGSGKFPEMGFLMASYIKNLKVAFSYDEFSLIKPSDLSRSVTADRCYNISTPLSTSHFDTSFYFGGPAMNLECL